MDIQNLEIGKEYLRIHSFAGQETQKVKILKVEEKTCPKSCKYMETLFVQTYPTEKWKGGGKMDTFNTIECERYLRPV